MLIHDDTLDRTTSGSGLVSNFTFDEISHLDAGYFFYNSKSTVRVPSLNKVLEEINNKNKSINIELKPNKGLEKINVDKIVDEIKNFSLENNLKFLYKFISLKYTIFDKKRTMNKKTIMFNNLDLSCSYFIQ